MRSPRIKWTGFVGAFALVGMSLLSACGDNNSSSSITQPQVNEKVTESSSSVDEGSSVIVSEADECRLGSKKFPENYCCQYYGVQCTATPKSSSSVESSSSVASDVSAVWTGKMEMPKTQTIDGKSYMIIETAEELAYFADQVTNKGNERLNARLVKNIRLNVDNMVDENGNLLVDVLTLNEWTPVGGGTNAVTYKGTFDGNGHRISGIYVNKPSFQRAGFIGTLGGTTTSDSGFVKKLGIVNSYIVGNEQVGGIVGRENRGQIDRVFNRGSYVKGKYAGGIVGYQVNGGRIIAAYNTGTIVSPTTRAAGIVGMKESNAGVLLRSYNVGFIIAPSSGVAAGISTNNSSKNCFYAAQSDKELKANGATEKSKNFMATNEFVSTLNGLAVGERWTRNDNINNGFPIFDWEL